MKYLFLFVIILFAERSFAQQPYYDFKKFKQNKDGQHLPLDLSKQDQIISKDSLEKIVRKLKEIKYSLSSGKLVMSLANGNNIYALPQDNMACIVPDLSQFNMPNAGRGIKITGMPPGSAPQNPIIPPQNK